MRVMHSMQDIVQRSSQYNDDECCLEMGKRPPRYKNSEEHDGAHVERHGSPWVHPCVFLEDRGKQGVLYEILHVLHFSKDFLFDQQTQ